MLKKYNTSIVSKITVLLLSLVFVITSAYLPGSETSAASTPKSPKTVTISSAKALNQTQVKVTWKKVKGASGYQVYRKQGTGKWTRIKTVKSASKKTYTYTDKNAKANTKYQYKVRAYKTYKRKQYYNSKTKKWVTKKPAKKNWKGKKTRNVTKYKYGDFSDEEKVTTPGEKSCTGVDPDPEFTESVLPKTETYIKDYQAATVYLLDSRGRITWTKDDPDNVISITVDTNGCRCAVKFNKAGRATLTAKSETSGKTKSIKLIIASSIIPDEDEEDNGIKTPYGKIYPNEGTEKSFTVTKDGDSSVKIGNVTIPASTIPQYLPDGSIIKIDAKDMMVKHPVAPYPEWTGTHSADTQSGWITSEATSSNPTVATVFTNGIDVVSTGIYFINSGETDITFSNGKVIKFIVTGKNEEANRYINYVQNFISANSGKTKIEIANNACALVSAIPYGPSHSALLTITNSYGNCYGKNFLLYRLLYEADIDVKIHRVIPDKGDHRCLKITIADTTYFADTTVSDSIMSRAEYESLLGDWVIAEELTVRKVYKLIK